MNGLLYQSGTDGTMSRYAATAVEPEPLCFGIIGRRPGQLDDLTSPD